jgi:threonine aldolase
VLDPATVMAGVRDASDDHVARVSLLALENTHNRHGGSILPLERLVALARAARARGLKVHLDGARLWNASVATGVTIREWAAHADTLMMCFSKGLGAPVGSILVGGADDIRRARRVRKRWGGGMRQVGILAAACLHALDHHVERLADDHINARLIAGHLAGLPQVDLDITSVQTNIVIFNLREEAIAGAPFVEAARQRGVLVVAFGPRTVRAVTHLDVTRVQCERAGEILAEVATIPP